MEKQFNFSGKQILITGASSGIGRATAIMLSKLGANIIMISSNSEKLNKTFELLDGVNHRSFQYDLSDIDKLEPKIKEIISQCGPVDGFVHSAGIAPVRPLNMTKYEFILNVMNINFFSFIEIVRCITKKNAFNSGLSIVGVSAIGAFIGNVTKTAYCSSKAAMNSAVRCLGKELAVKNIRINTVAPGVTNTLMLDDLKSFNLESNEYKSIIDRQYLGICEPEDIAESIIFLLSNSSRMISGSCIPIDGGKLTT